MATATTRTLPTPPPVTSYPSPSPSKKDSALKPNPHPYAIKTTSTGILTRSNSSGYNVNATHNYYIPTSPSPSRSDPAKGHRYSKSLNLVPESPSRESPRPLPIPPALDGPNTRRDGSGGSGGYVSADEVVSLPPRRPRRSSTLPVIPIPSPVLSAPSVDDLPENPKLWTPSQLAVYLTTALRMTSGGKPGEIESIGLPALVAKDIAAFVKSARIGGRTFLRLNEDDLEGLGMNKKWRDALLTAARNLRQNVLKGRIWGVDGSPATSPSPQSASPPTLFSNPELNSSSSSIESGASLSSAEDESGAALGRSKARRYRNGRVRGMIETFERSGSFSSDGGYQEGEDGPGDERTNLRRWARQEGRVTGQRIVDSPSPSKRRPLPMPPSPSGSHSSRVGADDEPTMETLLAELSKQPMTGARAWEEMDMAPGDTVKRVPEGQAEAQTIYLDAIPETIIGSKTVTGLGSGRSSGGSSKGKSERRVVTAIFAPSSPSKDAHRPLEATNDLEAFPVGDASPERHQKSRPLPATPADGPEAEVDHLPQPVEPDTTLLERLLEEEILATRALLESFGARLEVVEQKVADLETKEVVRERELSALALHPQTRPAAEPEAQGGAPSVEIGVQSSAAAMVDAGIQSEALDLSSAPPSPDALSSTVCEPANAPSGSNSAIANRKGKGKAAAALASTAASSSALQAVTSEVVRRLHAPASSLFAPSSALAAREDGDEGEGEGSHPANLGDLPSYVLLVGLGMCAVVIQVVLRKVVGKGSGLRPY
ncbi:hypothetical protein C8Q80DRAFT_675653 [Daedaleopsis nitida]|nr:hypothetical protein C8Q80DRAFT_675653 [Daedaleopsis nitida]